jgi:hypothetical protein
VVLHFADGVKTVTDCCLVPIVDPHLSHDDIWRPSKSKKSKEMRGLAHQSLQCLCICTCRSFGWRHRSRGECGSKFSSSDIAPQGYLVLSSRGLHRLLYKEPMEAATSSAKAPSDHWEFVPAN